jgi:hypothetical protein
VQIDDLTAMAYALELHEGATIRAVGWLGKTVPRRGRLGAAVLDQLRHYRTVAFHDEGDLGNHVCELCGRESGRGEFWIEWNGLRYVLPALALHYCEAHDYLPPEEFLIALASRWALDFAKEAG